MKNIGASAWPQDVTLAFVGGVLAPEKDSVSVPQAAAGETVNISVKVKMPSEPGRYTGYYRLITKDGHRFGQRVWVDSLVVPANQVSTAATVPAAPVPVTVAVKKIEGVAVPVTETKTAAADKEKENGKYAQQLRKLKNMGFKDEEMLTDLLIAAGGKEQQVIDWLVQPVV
jgi:next-to-BRCA1 protein 1